MPRAGLTEERLVQAGAELIAEKGVGNFSVRALAARLGVKAASLYNHMESASDLMRKIGMSALDQMSASIDASQGSGRPDEQLCRVAHAYRAFAAEHPELYRVIMQIPASGDDALVTAGRALARFIRAPLDGLMTEQEQIHFSRAFRSAMHGFVMLELSGFFADQPSADSSYSYLIASLTSRLGR